MGRFQRWLMGITILVLIWSSLTWAESSNDSNGPVITPVPLMAPNLAGSETQLLPRNFDVWACDWSADGKSLIFAGKLQGEDNVKMRIWYWVLDPVSDPVPLTNTEQLLDFSPRWSPDGSKVVMSRRSLGKNINSNLNASIWLKEMSTGAGKQLTNGPEDRDPAWSPDGTQIVFSRGQGPYIGQLHLINLNDGTSSFLAGQEGELLISPCWGKDGNIYYTKQTPAQKSVVVSTQTYQVMDFGKGGIWSINPVTGNNRPVVADNFDNRLPALSPDGTKLAFVSNRIPTKEGNGKFDRGSLFIKNMNTGDIRYVTNKVGLNGGSLSWSPDGKKLAFFTFRGIRPAVWVIGIP